MKKCPECRGHGIVSRTEEISINIPAGIENGEMIRMSGLGEASTSGVAGDLYIKIHVKPHPLFRREGADLVMDLPVKLSDALLGGQYAVKLLDDKVITVEIPEGTSSGEILRIKGKGVPIRSGRRPGDLLIKIVLKIPTRLSKEARKIIEDLRKEGI